MIRLVFLAFLLIPFKSFACFQLNTESFKTETREIFLEILGLFEMLESILHDTISYYEAEPERFTKKKTDSPLKSIFPNERKLSLYFKTSINHHKQYFLNDLKTVRRFKKYLEHYLIKSDFKEVENTYARNSKITDYLAIKSFYQDYEKLFPKLREKEPKIENDLVMASFCMSFVEKINEYIHLLRLNINEELNDNSTDKEKIIHKGLLIIYNNSPIYKQDETYTYIKDKLFHFLKEASFFCRLINQSNCCPKYEENNVVTQKPISQKTRKKMEIQININEEPTEIEYKIQEDNTTETNIYESIIITPIIEMLPKEDQQNDFSCQIIYNTQHEISVDTIEEDRWWTKINVEKLYRKENIYSKTTFQNSIKFIPKKYSEEEKIDLILAHNENDLLQKILKPGRTKLKELDWLDVSKLLTKLGASVDPHSGSRFFVILNREKTCFHSHGKIYEDTINTHLKGFLVDALFKIAHSTID